MRGKGAKRDFATKSIRSVVPSLVLHLGTTPRHHPISAGIEGFAYPASQRSRCHNRSCNVRARRRGTRINVRQIANTLAQWWWEQERDRVLIRFCRAVELIDDPGQPIVRRVTRRLGRQRVSAVAIRGQDRKLITLGGHASDDVPAARIGRGDAERHLVKTQGFRLASFNVFGLVRQTTCQRNDA
jgi:hypothetical protein